MLKKVMVRLPQDIMDRLTEIRDKEQTTYKNLIFQAVKAWLRMYDRRKGAKL